MYKSFSLFHNTLAFRQLDEGIGTLRDQGLQGAHWRLSYLFVMLVQQVTYRFSSSNHLVNVSLLIGEGEADRKQNWASDLVQWRGAGDEMLWFSCTWALHMGSTAGALGAIPGALGVVEPAGSGWETGWEIRQTLQVRTVGSSCHTNLAKQT